MIDDQTIQVYDDRSDQYARENAETAARDPYLAGFISACPTGGRVLDLGCGPGHAAKQMAQTGLETDATDASSQMVALAALHPGVSARQATFDQISGTAIYDGIWASFSLLHASRAAFPGHLAAIHTALKPNGTFYIGMKLGTDEARDDIGRLYTYYTADGLQKHLQQAGFTVLNQSFGSSIGLDGVMADWVAVTAHG
jgi:SAM-dependent methyltransferase